MPVQQRRAGKCCCFVRNIVTAAEIVAGDRASSVEVSGVVLRVSDGVYVKYCWRTFHILNNNLHMEKQIYVTKITYIYIYKCYYRSYVFTQACNEVNMQLLLREKHCSALNSHPDIRRPYCHERRETSISEDASRSSPVPVL